MSKSIPAIVTPELLSWARQLENYTQEDIAKKLHVNITKVEAWERGEAHPTMRQAKDFAKLCHIPFIYLYLPDIPKKVKRIASADYRTFSNHSIDDHSRELQRFLRDVEDRRDIMIALYNDTDITPQLLDVNVSINSSEDVFAKQIRDMLSLTNQIQARFRKPDEALKYCITKLEQQDFLIFQAVKIMPEEMRGLSLAYDIFPVIALNRKDESSARLFTLVHELVHILSRTSGICNDMTQESTRLSNIELYCNRVAGLALVPTSLLLCNPNANHIEQYGLDDTYIYALARDFAVSKEVILHRLWEIGIIERETYFDTLDKYTKEYNDYKEKTRKNGFPPPEVDKGTQVGRLYTRTVLAAYHADAIGPREVSNYLLGLNTKHFDAIERWCYK